MKLHYITEVQYSATKGRKEFHAKGAKGFHAKGRKGVSRKRAQRGFMQKAESGLVQTRSISIPSLRFLCGLGVNPLPVSMWVNVWYVTFTFSISRKIEKVFHATKVTKKH